MHDLSLIKKSTRREPIGVWMSTTVSYLELLRRTIRKPTIITMNNEETIRPDTSHTEIELTSSLLCSLPSGLGPKLGRELGWKLGTWKQSMESSKLRTARDYCHKWHVTSVALSLARVKNRPEYICHKSKGNLQAFITLSVSSTSGNNFFEVD